MPNSDLVCRVCGLAQAEPPWGEDGKTPSFDFCPCCGAEFGYQDASLVGIRNHREKWLAAGAPWEEPDEKPAEWSSQAQLENVPPQYR